MDRRRLLGLARAAAAALAIVATVVGLPVALTVLVGWPLPTTLPSIDQVVDAARRGVEDRMVVKALAVLCWMAWAQFVLALALEVEAVARHRAASRPVLVLSGAQRLASRLVAAVLMSSSLLPGRPALAQADPHPYPLAVVMESPSEPATPAAVVVPAPFAAQATGGEPDAAAPREPARAAYRVERDDSYWRIAERFLGDGRAWHRVREINLGRTMPDGTTITRSSTRVEPGWLLLLPPEVEQGTPGTTGPGGDAAAPAEVAPDVGVIERDGHLWALAKGTLIERWGRVPTDAEIDPYWRRVIEANRPRLADPANPSLVFAGQEFTLPPAPPPPEVAPFAVAGPRVGEGEPGGDGAVDRARPSEGPLPAADPVVPVSPTSAPTSPATTPTTFDLPPGRVGSEHPATGEASAPGEPVAPPATGDDPGPTDEPAAGDGTSRPLPGALAAGGMATVGIVLALNRLRRAQQRRRRTGRSIPLPSSEIASAETQLRAGADEDAAHRLDLATRALGALGAPLEAVDWVTLRDGDVELTVRPPTAAPVEPFTDAGTPGRWRLPAAVATDALEDLAGGVASALPALVLLGSAPGDAEVLVDAERLGVIGVDGPPDVAVALVRDLGLSAATAPWADDAEVVLVGHDEALEALPWVRVVPDLAHALDYVAGRARATEKALGEAGVATPLAGRLGPVPGDAFEPTIAVSLVATTEDDEASLARLAASPHRGFVVLVPGRVPAPGWQMVIKDDGVLAVPGAGVELRPHLLGSDRDLVGDLLATAARRGDAPRPEPTLAPADLPPEAEEEVVAGSTGEGDASEAAPETAGPEPTTGGDDEEARGDDGADVVANVLGDVEVLRGDGERLRVLRAKSREVIAYLAAHSGGVLPEVLEAALWPDGSTAGSKVFNVTLSQARRALGADRHGDDHLPPVASAGGLYRLGPGVTSDLARFRRLVARAGETAEAPEAAERLREALGLVRGEPFGVRGRGRYAWCHGVAATIEGEVVDAAEHLGELALAAGDPATAEWAARRGLLAGPYDERLFRLLMRAADAGGNPAGVEAVFTELVVLLEAEVEPFDAMHPETAALYEALARGRRPAPADSAAQESGETVRA